MDHNGSAVKLEARAIPVPASVSAEAQAALARLIARFGPQLWRPNCTYSKGCHMEVSWEERRRTRSLMPSTSLRSR